MKATRSPRRRRWRTWHRVVLAAEHERNAAGHRRIGSEHLLAALVSLGHGVGVSWLREQGLEPARVRAHVRRELDRRGGDPHGLDPRDLEALGLTAPRISLPGARPGRRLWSPDAVAVVDTAYESARRAGRRAPTADDLLRGIVDSRGCRARRTLADLDVDLDRLRAVLDGRQPPPALAPIPL